MSFKKFRDAVEKKFNSMKKHTLFVTSANRDNVWEKYLDAFPEGTNKIFKERREYDCNHCRKFLKSIGNVVAINGNSHLVSIWDIKVDGYYQEVADAISIYVKSFLVQDIFVYKDTHVSRAISNQLLEDGTTIRWNHFSAILPSQFVTKDVSMRKGKEREAKGVFERGVESISRDSIDIVLDLIAQNSLYRGEEFRKNLKSFSKLQQNYKALKSKKEQDNFLWANVDNRVSLIKNTVIGTLLEDLSNDKGIEASLNAFESKVAPSNYKRSSAPVTQGMVKEAIKKIDKLGLESSLHRRFAVARDVSINNVLFADRSVSALMKDSLLSMLMREVRPKNRDYDKVEEISIDDFINNILPKVEGVELLVKNRHSSNFMSLIAPKYDDANSVFQWDNAFSWSYNGEITDASIKERVKRAGGSVTGDLRGSLSWFNSDDLDIQVIEPRGFRIAYDSKISPYSNAKLDVDMNVSSTVRDAVENITWAKKNRISKGLHQVKVHNFTYRESIDVGFVVEVEYLGAVHKFFYNQKISDKELVNIFDFEIKDNEIIFSNMNKKITQNGLSQDIWNIKTEAFQKVSMVMLSPNHWDGNSRGNRHHFFILDGCQNPKEARGFYNEFLRTDLMVHRKVFEVLADKMKCEKLNEQLSGLGFSSTKRDEIICRVKGSFNRVLKIKF